MCDASVPPGEEQLYATALQFLGIDGWDRKGRIHNSQDQHTIGNNNSCKQPTLKGFGKEHTFSLPSHNIYIYIYTYVYA